jgi:phosphoglucomutase
MLKDIFDFPLIKKFFETHTDFKVLFDALSGVTGPYGKAIFEHELGLPSSSTQNCIPSPDFNGGHPDPNLTYAHSLVEAVDKGNIHFGAASDGDGDRNMIYGANAFVSPGDSLAIIAHYAKLIPYFKKQGVYGLARSMPTSGAVDLVAKAQGLNCYEVPTGWKFFCALFDADKLSICGEESFGTGSNHIREKDGLWAVVAWLNIIAGIGEAQPDVTPSIAKIQHDFWTTYGRTFFTRYDYENVSSEGATEVVKDLTAKIADKSFVGSKIGGMYLKPYFCLRANHIGKTAQWLTLATSHTLIWTAAYLRTRACTSSFPMDPVLSFDFPELVAQERLFGCMSRSTPVMRRHTVWMPKTS